MLGESSREDLFDETRGYDDETGIQFASGLTPTEIRQATTLYRLFNDLWGVCIVVGDPGTGKDLFGNIITYKIKTYFPWKKILRDEKPRRIYGSYEGLFNEQVLAEDLAKMKALAEGASISQYGELLEQAADDWVTQRGRVLLKNSVLYLTEFWRYCYNREPMNPMNKTMGGIHKEKRHIDVLILGTVQNPAELDKKTCLPWIDWQVHCVRSSTNKTGFVYFLQKVKYDRRLNVLEPLGKPFPMAFDAGKPRDYLGDGQIKLIKRNYKPASEEERIVLEVIKAGGTDYDEIVEYIEDNGDMEESEILQTLKDLKFIRSKRVIDYPCFFSLYNSKSAPQMGTSLKVGE